MDAYCVNLRSPLRSILAQLQHSSLKLAVKQGVPRTRMGSDQANGYKIASTKSVPGLPDETVSFWDQDFIEAVCVMDCRQIR